ncbi:MAG: phosphate signaling complex protein PhoU [Firmicutes bacterium]|nr:phosphate signaling complex protein PhoU [Bacillota bacterium]
MRNKFDGQLKLLNDEMVQMCNMIQEAIHDTVEVFFDQDIVKAEQIMNDDQAVDQKQKTIENICFQLLIQQQPVARDLRNITAALKMVTDMERIGDHAADISEITVSMGENDQVAKFDHIKNMAAETMLMLNHSIEAFVERDKEKADKVIAHDDIVDDLFDQAKNDIIDMIREEPNAGEYATDLLMVAKYFERIGDHATNIAEWVLFSMGKH